MTGADMTSTVIEPVVGGADALVTANADATKAYRNLSKFRIEIVLESDGWHVDYELRNPDACGGGPHYVIDASTGTILYKRYDQ
jgi:ribosomal protein L10